MKILIVDDNDRYATNLEKFLTFHQVATKRARDAAEGWEMFQKDRFDAVITDITMETQTSGLWLSRKIFKSGYTGDIIIATTGFDVPGVMFFSRFFLPVFSGVGWMIPKKPLKKGEVQVYPTLLNKGNEFIKKIS